MEVLLENLNWACQHIHQCIANYNNLPREDFEANRETAAEIFVKYRQLLDIRVKLERYKREQVLKGVGNAE